ncbi:ribosome biogenesis protein WDR12 homolog [Ornithodoros turicata]|uniref:ribosome biogenesis protein WDR12 homolog n=1 Tax=Ornithodoros turicata TaxID=34597 RepID=UPI0031393ADC
MSQVQVKFRTKDTKYSVPDTPFSVTGNASATQLSSLIHTLIKESASDEETRELPVFDFLVNGELLRLPLEEHLHVKEISQETVIHIEYFTRCPPPRPIDSLVHDDWVSAVHASADGILSGCYDNTLHIWDADGKHKLMIPGHMGPVKAIKWVSSGNPICIFVSTSHDETAMLWQWNKNANAIESVHVCKGHARSVDCVDVDGTQTKFATGSYDHMLKIWSADPSVKDSEQIEDGSEEGSRKKLKTTEGKTKIRTPVLTLSGHHEAVTGVQWTDDSEVATCSMDNTLRLWDVELGGLKTQLVGSKAFLSISHSKLNKQIISGSTDRHIRLWDPRTKEGSVVKCSYTSHVGWVSSVCWSSTLEYQFISGGYDGVLKLWDSRCPKASLYDMSGHEDKILAANWSVSKYMISGGADNQMKIFEHNG